jgi:hypothetical protein
MSFVYIPKAGSIANCFCNFALPLLRLRIVRMRQCPSTKYNHYEMVKLTNFLWEACLRNPTGGCSSVALKLCHTYNGLVMLFRELIAYGIERTRLTMSQLVRNPATNNNSLEWNPPKSESKEHTNIALSVWLCIIRYVYGLRLIFPTPWSIRLGGAAECVHESKELCIICDGLDDREALLVFITSAPHGGKSSLYKQMDTNTIRALPWTSEHIVLAAVSN